MGKRSVFKIFIFAIVLISGFFLASKIASEVKAGCGSGWYCYGSTYIDIKNGCKRDSKGRCVQSYWANRYYGCQNAACGFTLSESCCNTSTCLAYTCSRPIGCCAQITSSCGDGSCNGSETCSSCPGDCGSCCSASAPSNLSLTKISSSTWRLSWTLGSGSTQHVYIGTSKTAVEGNCAAGTGGATGCTIKDEAVGGTTTTYNVSGLTEGVIYYSRVVAYNSSSCNSASATGTSLSSCALSPSTLSIQIGEPAVLSSVVDTSSEIGSVSYTKSGAFVSVSPTSDSSYAYSTTVTGVSAATGTVTNTVLSPASATLCTSAATVTVLNPGPWWQAIDGDITTNGDLLSGVPFLGTEYLDKKGAGGYPGIPVYGGTTDVTSDYISETKWAANSTTNTNKIFNSNFYLNSIPSDVTPTQLPSSTEDGTTLTTLGTEKYGYYWYEYDPALNGGADLTLTGPINIGSRKVILIVNGANVLIQGNITVTKGSGFFMLVAGKSLAGNGGNIQVDPLVGGGGTPNLEGIFVADNQFITGTSATQLYIHGTVAAYGGVSLERDLGGATNSTTPAEVFEYAPELELLYPTKLGTRAINWQEVAP